MEYVVLSLWPPLPVPQLPPEASALCSTNTVAINVEPSGIFVQHFSTVLKIPLLGLDDLASDDQVYTSIDDVSPTPALLKNLYETCSIHPVATCKIEDAMQNTKS
jgi:hypothetical protein